MVSVMVRAGASMAWAAAFPRSEATLASCSARGGQHGRAWCHGCVHDEVRLRNGGAFMVPRCDWTSTRACMAQPAVAFTCLASATAHRRAAALDDQDGMSAWGDRKEPEQL